MFMELININYKSFFLQLNSEVFSFVLTESDGDRRFGYCLRKLATGSGMRYPIAFCVLSFL